VVSQLFTPLSEGACAEFTAYAKERLLMPNAAPEGRCLARMRDRSALRNSKVTGGQAGVIPLMGPFVGR